MGYSWLQGVTVPTCHNVGYSLVCERESVQAEESASKESVIIVVQVELSKELAEKPDLHLTFQRPNWASKPFELFKLAIPNPFKSRSLLSMITHSDPSALLFEDRTR